MKHLNIIDGGMNKIINYDNRRKSNKNVLKGCITSGYRSVKLTFENSK